MKCITRYKVFISYIQSLIRRCVSVFRGYSAHESLDKPPVSERESNALASNGGGVLAPKADTRSEDVETAGRWYFRRDILDRIDEYFVYLRRMKRCDPEAYSLFSQVGGYITNTYIGMRVCTGETSTIDPAWRINGASPSFGMVTCIPTEASDEDSMHPRLIYFQKVGRSWRVERSEDDVYRVCAFIAAKEAKFRGLNLDHPVDFHVTINAKNEIRLLRELSIKEQRLKPSRASGYMGRVSSSITRLSWGLPQNLKAHIDAINRERDEKRQRGHKFEDGDPGRLTPEDHARFLFSIAANWQATATADVHVKVSKDGLSAVFCVDLLRMPHFFRDRETDLASDGRRKRIFHIVGTHQRKSGSYVKSHFRGQRKFTWNGADIYIWMPGKHHAHLGEFTAGFNDLESLNTRRGYLSPRQLGKKLAQYMSG